MAMLALAGTVVSTIAGIAGAKQEAASAAQQAEYRADADKFNAKVAEQKARAEMNKSRADAQDFRRDQRARLAASRARRGGSGVALEGSPLLVDEAAFTEIEFGVARITNRGQIAATRLRNEASLLKSSAKQEGYNARSARRAGTISAIGIGAAGAAKFGQQVQSMAQSAAAAGA